MAAVVIFTGHHGKIDSMKLEEWTAETAMLGWKGEAYNGPEDNVNLTMQRDDVLWQLKGLIVQFKHELFAEFRYEDISNDFHVPVETWQLVCGRILGDFPWLSLLGSDPQETIAFPVPSDPPSVCYTHFLARHQIRFRNTMGKHSGFRRQIACHLYEKLLVDDQSLRDTVATMDLTGNGRVSVRELQKVLSHVLPGVTEEQAWTMLRTTVAGSTLDNGTVSVFEFLESFQLRFSSIYAKPAPANAPWVTSALDRIGLDIIRKQHNAAVAAGHGCLRVSMLLKSFFQEADITNNGYLDVTEFIAALAVLPSCSEYSPNELREVANYCDLLNNGRMNYLEFLHAFNVEARGSFSLELHEDLLESIYRVLYFEVRSIAAQVLDQYFAPLGKQRCTPENFARALRTVSATQGLMTSEQVDILVETLSVDEDGLFDYRDFFSSFEVVDTALSSAEDDCFEN